MNTRTWPYGTTLQCTVLESHQYRASTMIVVEALVDNPLPGDREGFILMDGPNIELPLTGDKGSIKFMEGGPTGGYWKFKKLES